LLTTQLKCDTVAAGFGKGATKQNGIVARVMAEEDFGDEEGGVVFAGAREAFGGGEEEGCEG
jgi:hypothetical protein